MVLNLADELRGLKPCKTVTGRLVMNDDPIPPPKPRSRITSWDQVKDYVDKAHGEFSPMDIALETGIKRTVVSEYLSRLKRAGKIRKVGYITSGKTPMNLWVRV